MSLRKPGSVADTSNISPSFNVFILSATWIIGPGQERPQALSFTVSPDGVTAFPTVTFDTPESENDFGS